MTTISDLDLMQVTGGKAPAGGAVKTSGSGTDNDAVLTALTSIQNSIKDLGRSNNSLFGSNSGLLFMTMALMMSRQNSTVVYSGGGGGGCYGGGCYAPRRVGYSWRAWW
jgi:hypothetical protein